MKGLSPKQDLLERFAAEESDLVRLGQRIGVEALEAVLEVLGQGTVNLPSRENFWRRLERRARDERICAEFTGANYDELSRRYEVTPRQLRNILAAQVEAKKQTGVLKNAKASRP